jgi:hypothetical protein
MVGYASVVLAEAGTADPKAAADSATIAAIATIFDRVIFMSVLSSRSCDPVDPTSAVTAIAPVESR